MSTNGTDNPSVAELVSGIVGDCQDLGMQHLALFRREIQEDFRKTADALLSVAIGLAVTLIGGIAISLMLAHLLAQTVPSIPLWGAYGIVGVVITVLGGIAVFYGIQKLRTAHALSRQATKVMEGDVEWLTNAK